jgi:alkylhydroperoxidase family enzyme
MPLIKVEKSLSLDPELVALVKVHIANQNECYFCSDIGMALAIKKRIGTERFAHLSTFATSPHFTEAERVALRFAEEINATCDCTNETFAALKPHFTERQIVEIAWVCAAENYYNRLSRPFGLHSDGLAALADQSRR